MTEPSPWDDAVAAAALFAVDPAGTGVSLRALAGPVRDRWLALLRESLPEDATLRRVPLNVPDSRLLGGLDLAATLRSGRKVAERGILAEADGGVLLLAMAERLQSTTVGRLTAVLDSGEVTVARDGLLLRQPARIGVVALDEAMAEEEQPPPALLDRLALHVALNDIAWREAEGPVHPPQAIAAARARLPGVTAPDEILAALCTTAMSLGIVSLRAPLLALHVARAAAALSGREIVTLADAALAGRLVLAPRATQLPAEAAPPEPPPEPPPPDNRDGESPADDPPPSQQMADMLLAAAQAAIPAGLLAMLRAPDAARAKNPTAGRAGAAQKSGRRGRPAGVRPGDPRAGDRLNLVETLRAAAPWQPLRRRESPAQATRVLVRREDFRVTRHSQPAQTTTIFAVDASGSLALNRLAEAKGCVELLLADCYVRRDQVAVIAFRGRAAELLLPPTRALARAKRSLASLPGGGGTPLAAGIDAALALADLARRRGETPTLVLLTDGRANVARSGAGGRAQAEQDAISAARLVRAAGCLAIVVDTSPRPHPFARSLAGDMGARYLPLPFARAASLSTALRAPS